MLRSLSTSTAECSPVGIRRVRTTSTSFGESDTNNTQNVHKPLQASGSTLSFAGLMATKRLARRLTSRVLGRSMNTFSSSRMSGSGSVVQKEPTYRLEPNRIFSSVLVKNTLKTFLTDRLGGFRYNSKICSKMSKILSDEIKEKVKALQFDRYKIVAIVMIGDKSNQGTVVASEAVWNPSVDNYATYTYVNKDIYCTAIVYGLYNE